MTDIKDRSSATKEGQIMTIHKSFKSNLAALKSFVDTFNPIASKKDLDQLKQMNNLVDTAFASAGVDINKHIEENKGKNKEDRSKLELTQDQLHLFLSIVNPITKISIKNEKLLSQSSFVLLIGHLEYLFADLLRFYYKNYPGQISDKPITVVINELKTYDSVEDAVEYLISKEVETLLFEMSFPELIIFFQKSLKIRIDENLVDWQAINEARERRHIIVHNNSIINKKYLSKSKIDGLPDKDELIIGEQIHVPEKYFENIFDMIYTAGELMVFACWRQWVKNDSRNMIDEILYTSFDCLIDNLNIVAMNIAGYSKGIVPCDDEEDDILLRCKFNYFIALKELKMQEELDKEMTNIRISTLSPVFKVAYFALKDDKTNVLLNLKKSKIADNFEEKFLLHWPLFKNLRSDAEFMEKARAELND